MVTNHAVQIIYAPRELEDAQEYSKLLGNTTIVRESNTQNRDSDSRTYSEEARPLMLPQELMNMDKKTEIIRMQDVANPIKCNKIIYYTDGAFTNRIGVEPVLLPAAVALVDRVAVVLERAMKLKLAHKATTHKVRLEKELREMIKNLNL